MFDRENRLRKDLFLLLAEVLKPQNVVATPTLGT